jgi:hypothetical protein
MDTSRTSMIRFYNPQGSLSTFSDDVGNENSKKLYCTRELLRVTECMNNSVLDCVVTFTSDKNVCVFGIQVCSSINVLFTFINCNI